MKAYPLDVLYDALSATGIPFTRFAWAKRPETLPVWGSVGVDGEGDSMEGDDSKTDQVLEGTVDIFAREAGPEYMRIVQDVLRGLEYAWRLNLVLYEDKDKLIHYQWVWQE